MTKSTRDWILFPQKVIFPISFSIGLILMVIAIRSVFHSLIIGIVILVVGTAFSYIILYSVRLLLDRLYPELPELAIQKKIDTNTEKTDSNSQTKNDGSSSISYKFHDQINDKDVIITQDYIEYNKKRLDFNNLTGIRYGIHLMSINNFESTNYTIHLTKEPIFYEFGYLPPKSSITIPIEFREGELTPSHVALKYHDQYREITQILLELAVLPSAQKMLKELHKKGSIRVGDLTINQDGISHSKKGLIRWDEYRGYEFLNGQIVIKSSLKSFLLPKQFSLSLKDTWNAVFLHIILDAITKRKS